MAAGLLVVEPEFSPESALLIGDRIRAANRLHDRLLATSPALEGTANLGNRGPLVLLAGLQTPTALRQAGIEHVTAWLRE
ncbi:hypothetical protein [Amycolatopsis nigrescens]|uniref:hypothetical protein n=1 Tax=Amycolatopsis nigrescens TaxID=381445 RepID=UPI000375BCCE|nr:hypothetical protein [Amycolatopsis nigrescens]